MSFFWFCLCDQMDAALIALCRAIVRLLRGIFCAARHVAEHVTRPRALSACGYVMAWATLTSMDVREAMRRAGQRRLWRRAGGKRHAR